MNKFNVLVIDDKSEVLTAIKQTCEQTLSVNNKQFLVKIKTVKVDVEEVNGKFVIKDKTIEDISQMCRNPLDLILVDYGYTNKKSEECIKTIVEEKKSFVIDDLDNIFLTILDLGNKIKENKRSKINKAFLQYDRTVILYTYNPKQFVKYFPLTEIKTNLTNRVFPKAQVVTINTSEQLFSGNFEEKHDSAYYAFLVSKYLNRYIEVELHKHELVENKKQMLKTLKSFLGKSTLIGLILGVMSEYLGGLGIELIKSEEYVLAISFLLVPVIAFVIGGGLLLSLLEKKFNTMDL